MADVAQKVPEVQRIRGSNLSVLIRCANGVAYQKALESADTENRVIASSRRMDKALVGSDEWKSVKEGLACWTGTITGYVEPKTAFGKSKMFSKEAKAIVYTDPNDGQRYVFQVDEKYLGEKNGILVVEHPDFKLGYDGKDLVVMPEAGKVELVSNFPAKDGWYRTDAKFGIPTGKETSSDNSEARYLYRIDDAGRVGPVARGYDYLVFNNRRYVGLGNRPSVRIGVVVEEPARGAGAAKVAGSESSVSGSAPLETAQLKITQEGQRLIVEGTPEQLQAALKLLEQLRQ